MIASNKLAATLLIVGGFAAWLAAGSLFGGGPVGSIVGAAAFFIVSCFLPETRQVTFHGRKSALGAVGFFTWSACGQYFHRHPNPLEGLQDPMLRSFLEVVLPLLLGASAYWLSEFLIRGFRASPEYQNNQGSSQPATRPESK